MKQDEAAEEQTEAAAKRQATREAERKKSIEDSNGFYQSLETPLENLLQMPFSSINDHRVESSYDLWNQWLSETISSKDSKLIARRQTFLANFNK